jgi:hypothetical protein
MLHCLSLICVATRNIVCKSLITASQHLLTASGCRLQARQITLAYVQKYRKKQGISGCIDTFSVVPVSHQPQHLPHVTVAEALTV